MDDRLIDMYAKLKEKEIKMNQENYVKRFRDKIGKRRKGE